MQGEHIVTGAGENDSRGEKRRTRSAKLVSDAERSALPRDEAHFSIVVREPRIVHVHEGPTIAPEFVAAAVLPVREFGRV